MKKPLKIILLILNLTMLWLAVNWYIQKEELEPLIVAIGQAAALLLLLFEGPISRIITTDVKDSTVKVSAKSGDHVITSRIDNSDINVKSK